MIINRINLQKHKLKNILIDFDETKTAEYNLIKNNYLIYYDSGNLVLVCE